jgi:hypothetical protein
MGVTTQHTKPGILTGSNADADFTGSLWMKYDQTAIEKLGRPGETIGGLGVIDPIVFARVLAKIAHSLAAAEPEFRDEFNPFLPDIILGKSKSVFHYVSGTAAPEPDPKGLHNLHIGWRELWPHYLVAYVRLFCNWGTPDYMIVVGERRS